jgi:hypothetical protein
LKFRPQGVVFLGISKFKEIREIREISFFIYTSQTP